MPISIKYRVSKFDPSRTVVVWMLGPSANHVAFLILFVVGASPLIISELYHLAFRGASNSAAEYIVSEFGGHDTPEFGGHDTQLRFQTADSDHMSATV